MNCQIGINCYDLAALIWINWSGAIFGIAATGSGAGMAGRSSAARIGSGKSAAVDDAGALDLQRYFPYRLARLAEQVSLAVAEVYAERFSLTRQEWRVLAALGARAEIATKEFPRLTTLDKMHVSRAMAGLEARGIVRRTSDPNDRRERIVALTAAGRALYRKIVPLALEREARMLALLSPEEIDVLDRAVRKLSAGLA